MATAADVKKLRDMTGAGMLDCKKALDEAQGDFEKAIELLRKRGQKLAAKKADRDASEGLIESYVHSTGKLAVLVELNCETDFVARNEAFKALAHDIALVVASANPTAVQPEEVALESIQPELDAAREEAEKEGKPAEVVEKVLAGKEKKLREQLSLAHQPMITNPDMTVQEAIEQAIGTLGENITLGRFVRLEK